jgi:EAL domain-containing protein (putative c-di-GMP-specific phosphodiesterase class I)
LISLSASIDAKTILLNISENKQNQLAQAIGFDLLQGS